MPPGPQPNLDYSSSRPPPRVPRVLVILGTAALGTYLIFLIAAVLMSTDPAMTARLTFCAHRSLLALALATGALYGLLRWRGGDPNKRISFPAVLSLVIALLNPALTAPFLARIGLRRYGGFDEVMSFAYGVTAVVIGVIAIVWIRSNHHALTGLRLAIAGVVIGGLWMLFWIVALLVVSAMMSGLPV